MKSILINLKEHGAVQKSKYIAAKTKALREFGYTALKESDVAEQVEKILKGDKKLSVIGHFCKDDIIV